VGLPKLSNEVDARQTPEHEVGDGRGLHVFGIPDALLSRRRRRNNSVIVISSPLARHRPTGPQRYLRVISENRGYIGCQDLPPLLYRINHSPLSVSSL